MSVNHRYVLVLGLATLILSLTVLAVFATPLGVNAKLKQDTPYDGLKDLDSAPSALREQMLEQSLGDSAQQDWWDETYDFRVEISIAAAGYARDEKPVEMPVDFDKLLQDLGAGGTVDVDSLHVVETDMDGNVVSENIPFQYDPTSSTNGNLVILMTGQTPANVERHFQLYFDVEGPEDYTPQDVAKQIFVTDGVQDEGFNSVRIVTHSNGHHATYFYHKIGGGFSSLDDKDDKDWISYNQTAGSAGTYRGIPNLVTPADGGFFHPGRTGVVTEIVSQGPLKAVLLSTTDDGNWQTMWEIFPTYATLSVLKVEKGTGYWFLYEGTPGGVLNVNKDFFVRSNGEKKLTSYQWEGDLKGEEWLFFSDPDLNRSLFLVHHDEDDSTTDSYRPQENLMTVFGFGRERSSLKGLLNGSPRQFTIGLVDDKEYAPLQTAIHSAYKDVAITLGMPERRPYNLVIKTKGKGDVTVEPLKSQYAYGEKVTLTANPDQGWLFGEWRGDLAGDEENPTIEIEGDTEITAVFVQDTYMLSILKIGGGTVTMTPDKVRYVLGDKVLLEAFPTKGWSFLEWDGAVTGTEPRVSLTITGNETVYAYFIEPEYYLPFITASR